MKHTAIGRWRRALLSACLGVSLAPLTLYADWTDSFLYRTHANGMPYRLYVPPGYEPTNQYPLVLFLHGAGGEGTDNEAHIYNGESGKRSWLDKSTFIVVPQASVDGGFTTSNNVVHAREVVDEVVGGYSVNTRRLYVTGLSRGGKGTWRMCAYYPDVFAAGVPICGWGNEWLTSDPGMDYPSAWAPLLIDIPIWAHHGLADGTVPPINSRWLYAKIGQAITNAGRAVNTNALKLTEYPGVDHNSWDPTYNDPAVNAWMFDQWLGETEPPTMPLGLAAPLVGDNHVELTWSSTDDPETVDSFEILRNGKQVAGSPTTSYRDNLLEPESNYTYHIAARNHRGMASPTSTAVAVSTRADYKPPEILSVVVLSWDQLQVNFSELIETQLTANAGNYSVDTEAAVLGAALAGKGKSVVLTTTYLSNAVPHVLTVHNAEDLVGFRANDVQAPFQHYGTWAPLPYAEDFEGMGVGQCLAPSNGWMASSRCAGMVVDDPDILFRLTNGYVGNFPLPTTHTRVLEVNRGTVTRLLAGTSGVTNRFDFMLEPAAWPSPQPPVVDADTKAALYLNPNGHLVLWHGYFDGPTFTQTWTELSHTPLTAPTQWVRVTMTHDTSYAHPFFSLQLNEGAPFTHALAYSDKAALSGPGPWFLAACTNRRSVSSFSASGCELEDLSIGSSTRAPEWTITILALRNGMIISSNNAAVPDAQDAEFTVRAGSYYHISDVETNGGSLGVAFGAGPAYSFAWSNITQHGTIQAFFAADTTTNTHTPLWWLAKHYGETNYESVALLDTDGDGVTAAEEQIADTQPTNAGSVFRHRDPARDGAGFVLRWPSASNRLYTIERIQGLRETQVWQGVAVGLPATPAENTFTVMVDNVDAAAYRIGVRIDE